MRSAQGMPINMIGVIVIMVLVVVAISVFFFAGLSEQSGVLGSTSSKTTEGLGVQLNKGICGLGGSTCGDKLCCDPETTATCAGDCPAP